MALTIFQQLPWIGGLNTSLDESLIPANQLTVADNVIFDTRGSRKKRDGIKHNYDNVSTGSASLIGLHDYWYGSTTKTQRLISVGNNRVSRSYNAGTATTLTDAGTAWSGTLNTCSMTTFNNRLIVAVSGTGNLVKMYHPPTSADIQDLSGTPPDASIVGQHVGRLLLNDKTNCDRLHYSPTHDHTLWNGSGDSGAIDIGVGDGDPDGITAFISWKGILFVFKRTKTYKIVGDSPETLQVILVSSGVGCISHNSISLIDQDDVFFMSEKGIHSLSATDTYGDVANTFVSVDIQKTFNDDLNRSRLKYSWGAYLNTTNSYAMAVASSGQTYNDTIYLFNILTKAWYKWSSLPSESLIVSNDSDKRRFYIGRNDTRVSKTFNSTNYDISTSSVNTSINYRLLTGVIFPDSNPYTLKAFKRFILYYRPIGSHQITVKCYVDNVQLATENQITYQQSTGTDLLGTTFILGSSILGASGKLGPYAHSIDGVGRGIQIEIMQSGTDQQVEIQGFGIEYEQLTTNAEILS